ncbi:hypothetical protein [Streptomyces sp. NPDC059460]|uniref:hypothetical protein n=1 Tax=Streptomyces sp. NPDC059460 TaxID=3346840 RepID=UPI00368435EE
MLRVEQAASRRGRLTGTKGKKDGATHRIIKIVEDGFVGGFNDPCDYKADAVFTENPIFDSAPARNDRVLCGKKL